VVGRPAHDPRWHLRLRAPAAKILRLRALCHSDPAAAGEESPQFLEAAGPPV